MQYQKFLPSQQYIPVVQQYGFGSPLGAILASGGVVTNQGTVLGFDANNNIICTSTMAASGGIILNSGTFYGFQLEVAYADAVKQGWPGKQSDVKYQGHGTSTYLYSV